MCNFKDRLLTRILMCLIVISSGAMTVLARGDTDGLILNYEIMRVNYQGLIDVVGSLLRVV